MAEQMAISYLTPITRCLLTQDLIPKKNGSRKKLLIQRTIKRQIRRTPQRRMTRRKRRKDFSNDCLEKKTKRKITRSQLTVLLPLTFQLFPLQHHKLQRNLSHSESCVLCFKGFTPCVSNLTQPRISPSSTYFRKIVSGLLTASINNPSSERTPSSRSASVVHPC